MQDDNTENNYDNDDLGIEDAEVVKPKPKAETKAKTKKGPSFAVKDKATMGYHLHQFKTDVQEFMLKTSGSLANLKFKPTKHKHVFKTHSKVGEPVTYTSMQAGHFHEVKWQENKKGELEIISVSEPLVYNTEKVKTPTGTKTKTLIAPAKYHGWVGDDENAEKKTVHDTHTHDLMYSGSQFVTPEIQSRVRDANKKAFGDSTANAALAQSAQALANSKASESDSDSEE